MIGHVLVTTETRGPIGPNRGLMDVVAYGAVGMPFAHRNIGKAVKSGQLDDLVTSRAAGLRRDGAPVWLVAGRAIPMPLRTS